jgi:hypothetical protein
MRNKIKSPEELFIWIPAMVFHGVFVASHSCAEESVSSECEAIGTSRSIAGHFIRSTNGIFSFKIEDANKI